MRDSLNTEKNLKDLIEFNSEILEELKAAIIQLEEDIAAGIKRYPKENVDIIFSKQIRIFSTVENLLDANFSIGNDCSAMLDLYKEGMKVLPVMASKMGYIDIIHFTSIGVLLGIAKEEMQTIIDVFDSIKVNDKLFDFIAASYGLRRSMASDAYIFGNPYTLLMDVVDIAKNDKDKASKLLTDYIEKQWINGHSKLGWKNLHKSGGYVGLWSYEAGAVAKILGLDDSNLADSNHYPYDLVHFREDTSFDAVDAGAAIDDGKNKTVVNEFSINNCPELDLIIPNEFREYIDQAIFDYNFLSDEDFLEKYDLLDIWFSLEEYKQDKAKGILGFIIVNLLVNKDFILQLDWKEDPADHLDGLHSFWNCEEKIVEFDVDNDQLYLARVPKEIEPANIYEVKIKNYIR